MSTTYSVPFSPLPFTIHRLTTFTMFSKLSLVALVAPLVSALVLEVPENPTTGGQITIKWTNQQGDPSTWSFELINQIFNNAFAIANNVDPAANSITLTLPIVPVGDGYTLEAVNIGNITDVFASTPDFAIGAATTSLSSSSSTATSKSSSGTSSTGSSTNSASTTPLATSPTPGFSSVISPPSSTPSVTGSSSATGSGTSTGANAASSSFSAALSSRIGLSAPFGGLAAAVLSAVAGAAMIVL